MQSENNPLLSIIVPVYNTAPYLEECLDSLRNQTLKNIEIICVNDGSTDNSLEILKKYELEDDRIVLLSQTNQGVSIARNTGAGVARGKYLFFLDSDDSACFDLAERSVSFAEKNGCDAVNIKTLKNRRTFFRIPYVRKLEKALRLSRVQVCSNITEQQREIFFFCSSGVANYVIRRDFWVEKKLKFPEKIRINEDVFLNCMVCSLANSLGFLFPERYMYNVRSRSDSASKSTFVEQKGERCKGWDILEVFKRLQVYFRQNQKNESLVYRACVIRYLCSLENLYFNVPQVEKKFFREEIDSVWDEKMSEMIHSSRFVPFRVRCFWLWLKSDRPLLKVFGAVFTLGLFWELRSIKYWFSRIKHMSFDFKRN